MVKSGSREGRAAKGGQARGPYVTRVTLKATQARGPTPPHAPGNGSDEALMNCSAVSRPPPNKGVLMAIGISNERESLSGIGKALKRFCA